MARRKRGRDLHGILLCDKPAGGSSNKVLQRVRRLYDANKAGHTGTLDPLATGMLPICFGEATKLSGYLIDSHKAYETTLKLGITTDTLDCDGDEIERRPVPETLTLSAFELACACFRGKLQQVPPMVSAIKVDGKRLYALAREGKSVKREPRSVEIFRLDILSFNGDTATLQVECSKGTYIRSLVSDIGERLGCGAHVTALRRLYVAPFNDSRMWTEGEMADHSDRDSLLLPLDAGLGHLPHVGLDSAGLSAFRLGQSVECQGGGAEFGIHRVYGPEGGLIGLGEVTEPGCIAPKRVLQLN